MCKVEPSHSQCCDGRVHGKEVCPLTDLIHYIHHRIMAVGFRELYYEVYANCIPPSLGDWERFKFSHQGQPLGLGSSTEVASLYILSYILRHLEPPVVLGY